MLTNSACKLNLRRYYQDIPWPPSTSELLLGASGGRGAAAADVRATYRRCILRWHPDKFSARFAARVAEGERAAVMERVAAGAYTRPLSELNLSHLGQWAALCPVCDES